MAGELTVSERILFHLNAYVKYEDKFESPFDVTQDGIAQACAISRAHAAIELKKLRSSEIVEERLKHVRRGKARRKCYFLTFQGKANAADVVQYVKENNIVPMVDPSKVSPELTSARIRSTRRSSPFPAVKEFFGRERELQAVREALALPNIKVLCIKGIAGIGKTTLVAKAVSELSGQRVFWYSSRPWDTPKMFADALGKFFFDNGGRNLAAYLASGKFELGELSFLLNEELAENGFAFVFDDVDASDGLQEFMRMFKHSSGSAKIIVTSESAPMFYERSEVVARREVAEIELGGLDLPAAVQLLDSRGIKGPVAGELAKVTHGHPLSLEMVTESSPTEAKYQISKFLEEKFYADLQDPERSLLQYSSVFAGPFPAEAIPRELRKAEKGSMLLEVAPGRFELHASLKDFVYGSLTKDERARWHSVAADYFLRAGSSQERLLHLIRANRMLEAEMLISRMGEALTEEGNGRLWEVLSGFEPLKPRYRQAVLLAKGRAAGSAGEYEDAWNLLEGLAKDGEPRFKAEALVEMGRVRSRTGDLESASRLFAEALEQSREFPDARARALRGLGVVESKQGDYSKAQELLERSAKDALSAMDQKGMLMAHMELGNVFIGRGMYEQAIDHFSKCSAGFGHADMANVYVNMGVACCSLGRLEEARQHLENAISLADETAQPRSKAHALTTLAEVLIRSKSIDQAKEHCFRALEILTEIGDKEGMSNAYANLGLAELNSKDLSASAEYYSESISSLDGVKAPRTLGLRKAAYGQVLAESGDVPGGIRVLGESVELFDRAGAPELSNWAKEESSRLAGGRQRAA